VTCEVLVGHLLLDAEVYERLGNRARLNPPIRERSQVEALWAGVLSGQIDCIATDHAPHSVEEKTRENVWEAVSGFLGVETMLPLLLTQVASGRLTLEQLVRLTSEQPARLYGHYPRKGSLSVGADADFVLVDLQQSYELDQARLHSKHRIMPFHGMRVSGRPVATYLRGACVVRDNQPVGEPRGQMLKPAQNGGQG
jgi:dihydroorotase-like cyclic amidohydrolase